MADEQILMKKGLDEFFKDMQLVKKIADMLGITAAINALRDLIALIIESSFAKESERVMNASQPEAVLQKDMAKVYNECKSDIGKLCPKYFTPEARDEFVKNYDGLKEYDSIEEGIAGEAALDTLHQINGPAIGRIYELDRSGDVEQAQELACRLGIFNKEFAKECEFAKSKDDLLEGLDRCEQNIGRSTPEIEQDMQMFKDNLKDYRKKTIGIGAKMKAWETRQQARAVNRIKDAIHSGHQKTTIKIDTKTR